MREKTNAWNKNAKCKYTASFQLIIVQATDYGHPMKAYIKEIWKFGPMWQTKYALAVLKNLGVGVDFGHAVKVISSPGVRSLWSKLWAVPIGIPTKNSKPSKIMVSLLQLHYCEERESFWSILHFYSVSFTQYLFMQSSRVFFFLPVGLQGQRPRIDYWWNADGRIVEHKHYFVIQIKNDSLLCVTLFFVRWHLQKGEAV